MSKSGSPQGELRLETVASSRTSVARSGIQFVFGGGNWVPACAGTTITLEPAASSQTSEEIQDDIGRVKPCKREQSKSVIECVAMEGGSGL